MFYKLDSIMHENCIIASAGINAFFVFDCAFFSWFLIGFMFYAQFILISV